MKVNWHRQRILLSSEAESVEADGLVFFRDGAIAVPGYRTLRRHEAIDCAVGNCRLSREEGSDVFRVTQVVGGHPTRSVWFVYEHNVMDKVYRLFPDQQVPWDAMPEEPKRASEFMIVLKRLLISLAFGLSGDAPPSF
jgi:hypothetical protein